MALDPRVLTQLATVKAELGIAEADVSKDARLERFITVATDLIESECGRRFAYEAGIVERVKGFGTPQIVVERAPIVSITSISELGTVLDAASYEALVDPKTRRAESGVILRKGADYSTTSWPWTASRRPDIEQDKLPGSESPSIVVTYLAGYVTPEQAASAGWAAANPLAPVRTLPFDLEQAAIEIVVSLYRGAGVDRNITLEAITDAQQSYGKGRDLIPEAAQRILRGYARIAGA